MSQRDLHYENTHRAYDWCVDDNFGIKCKNHNVCRTVLPDIWFCWTGNYLCMGCDDLCGELRELKNTECPVCLTTTRCVSLRNCSHVLCIPCYKRCKFPSDEGAPAFPYSKEIEDQYFKDDENPKWARDYPLIAVYNKVYDEWYDERGDKYLRETYLRNCPVCREPF